jgi:hypothetical protein
MTGKEFKALIPDDAVIFAENGAGEVIELQLTHVVKDWDGDISLQISFDGDEEIEP